MSQGNVYYYYYPVAAHPVNPPAAPSYKAPSPSYGGGRRPSSGGKNPLGGGGGGLTDSPLLLLLIPLVLLLVGIPIVAAFSDGGSGGIGRSLTDSRPFIEDAFRSFGSASGFGAEVDMLLSKYAMALQSEECMDRIICELGVNASGLQGKELFFSVVDWLIPRKEMNSLLGSGRMSVLKRAATDNAYSMDTCKSKFICNPPTLVQEDFDSNAIQFNLPSEVSKSAE